MATASRFRGPRCSSRMRYREKHDGSGKGRRNVGPSHELVGTRMYFCLSRTATEEPRYVVWHAAREVTLGTDLSTLLAEIDHWPVRLTPGLNTEKSEAPFFCTMEGQNPPPHPWCSLSGKERC